jgi:hypothetical protein
MKKTSSKNPKTPTPVKPAPASPKTSVSASAKKVKKAAKPSKVAPPASKDTVPAIKAPRGDSVPPTTIVAQIDVGFGNQLYVRGEGAGLSWEKGVLLDNLAADRWQLVLEGVTAPVTFKFLLNDDSSKWSIGEDFVVSPGSTLALVPLF